MTIGSKIKRIREIKQLTQEDMAEKIGMSPQGYGKIERDEADVSFTRLEQIAKVFNMKVEEMIAFDEKVIFNNFGTANDQSFSVNYESVSNKERELYEKTIKLLEEKIKWLEGNKQ